MVLPPLPPDPYELLPMPAVGAIQIAAIVSRHRLEPDGPVEPIPSTGVVHSLWALGSAMVLRVPKNEAMCLGDHRCEAAAIPLARAAGVRTPDLLVFDDSHDVLDVPFTVVERVHGNDLLAIRPGHEEHDSFYRRLGEQLGVLHVATPPAEAPPEFRSGEHDPPQRFFDDALAAATMNHDGIEWMRRLCERLDGAIAASPSVPRRVIHNDVKPDNAMVDRNGDVHLIDWGDAAIGDPVHDFHSLPLRSVVAALDGYRTVTEPDPAFGPRLVRRLIARSLYNLRRTPLPGPSWYRPSAATITDMLTFAVDHPDIWRTWCDGD